MSEASDRRLYLPHVARNREPILAVLSRVLPPAGLVLEVASGSGEHAAYFASALPSLFWQPTDCDPQALASIGAYRAVAKALNLLAALHLDVKLRDWPVERADALVCINMIHIAPWAAAEGLMVGARRLLRAGGVIYLYGPYRIEGRHTAESNRAFDAWLRSQNSQWGMRDMGEVVDLAAENGFDLIETVPMPANNLSIVFRCHGSPSSRYGTAQNVSDSAEL
jgi:SAM-dependent methyltransferase